MGRGDSIAWGVDLGGPRAIVIEARRRRGAPLFRAREVGPADTARPPVVAALPTYATFLRRLTAPLPSPDKARRVLPALLDIELPFPLESCAYDFLDLARSGTGEVEALAIAARTEDLQSHLARMRDAGFDPAVIEHEAVALWRQSVAEIPFARAQRRLLIYLGYDRTSLAIGGGRGLESATGIRLGADDAAGSPAQQAIAQRLAPWWRAQLAREGAAETHVVWCGPLAQRAETRDAVAALLFAGAAPSGAVHREPETFLARALAARWVTRSDDEGNLRRGALAHPDTERRARRGVNRRLVALAAAALLLATLNAGWRFALDRAQDHWQQRLESEARIVTGTDRIPRGQEWLAARRAIESDAAGWSAFHRAIEPGAQHTLARILASAGQHALTLHALGVRPQAVMLQGTAGAWEDSERLSADLAALGWRVQIERREAGADERVHFTLKGER